MIFKNPMGVDGAFSDNAPSNDNAQQIQQSGYNSQPLPHQQDTARPVGTHARPPFVPGIAGNPIDGNIQGPSTATFGPPAQIRHAPQLSASAIQPSISPATAFFHQQLHEFSPALTHSNDSRGLDGSSTGFLYQNPTYQQSGHVGNVPPVPPMMPQVPAYTGPVSQVWCDILPLCIFPFEMLTEIVTSHFHLGIQTLEHIPLGISRNRFSTLIRIQYSRDSPHRSHMSRIMATITMTLILMRSRRVNMRVALVN